MGTRVNYEIMLEDGTGPAAILYSNSHHPDMNPEEIFARKALEQPGPTSLVRELLGLVYTAIDRYMGEERVFWIDTCPGDRERVYRVSYTKDGATICAAQCVLDRLKTPGEGQ